MVLKHAEEHVQELLFAIYAPKSRDILKTHGKDYIKGFLFVYYVKHLE